MNISELIDQYEQGAKLRGLAPTQMEALKPVRRGLGHVSRPSILHPTTIGIYVRERRRGQHSKCHAGRPAKDGTIRRELGALQAVLNWGYAKGLLKDKPPSIDLPPQSPPRENFLTKEQADALWKKANILIAAQHPLAKPALFACMALDTWARANAIETLPWARVDLVGGRIDYRDPNKPETAKRRVPVPVSARLRDVLAAAPKGGWEDPVVGPITQYAWKQFVNWAGFPGLTRHDLRRTGISLAVARGVDLLKVAQMAGDNYDTILRHYARFAPDYLDGVVL